MLCSFVQATASGIRLVNASTKQLVATLSPDSGMGINLIAANDRQIICASGSEVYYVKIHEGGLELAKKSTMPSEVACVDLGAPDPDTGLARIAAVGLWDTSAHVLVLPDLAELHKEELKVRS